MSYTLAVACAREMRMVRQFELAARLGISRRTAVAHLARMQREGVVSRMDVRGWHAALDLHAERPDPEPDSRVVDRDGPAPRKPQYDAVRRLIARELHPDACDSDDPTKPLRAELFKRIWPQLLEITHAADRHV